MRSVAFLWYGSWADVIFSGLPWVWGSPWGSPWVWVWVWGEYGDDLPSPQTNGDSMGIFNQLEITR